MKFNTKQLQQMSEIARSKALTAVLSAHSGHVGIILDASEIITCIFANHLNRGIDRFVLSAGHGSALLYSVLKLAGYNIGDLTSFRKFGGLPGHHRRSDKSMILRQVKGRDDAKNKLWQTVKLFLFKSVKK